MGKKRAIKRKAPKKTKRKAPKKTKRDKILEEIINAEPTDWTQKSSVRINGEKIMNKQRKLKGVLNDEKTAIALDLDRTKMDYGGNFRKGLDAVDKSNGPVEAITFPGSEYTQLVKKHGIDESMYRMLNDGHSDIFSNYLTMNDNSKEDEDSSSESSTEDSGGAVFIND